MAEIYADGALRRPGHRGPSGKISTLVARAADIARPRNLCPIPGSSIECP